MDIVTLNPDSLKQWQDEKLEHLRYEYNIMPGARVLDIGAYRREWGHEIEKRYRAQVEYFEALDNRAAWVKDGAIELGGQFYYSSEFGEGPKTKYKCVDIAPFLQEETDLVKINIEGSEYNLLMYIIQSGCIKNIKYLQVQFHLIEGIDCEMFYEMLIQQLSLTHEIQWRYPFCWESWTRKGL